MVLEDGKQHPSVQLESKAFAGLPRKVLQYVTHVEGLVTRVQRLADSVEFVARCACIQLAPVLRHTQSLLTFSNFHG